MMAQMEQACDSTVPQADPATPQPIYTTNRQSNPMFKKAKVIEIIAITFSNPSLRRASMFIDNIKTNGEQKIKTEI